MYRLLAIAGILCGICSAAVTVGSPEIATMDPFCAS